MTPEIEEGEFPDEEVPDDDEGCVDDDGMTNWGGDIGDQYADFEKSLQKAGFRYVDYGSFRNVYQRGKVVVKIPHNQDGITDNRVEAAAWHKYKSQPTNRGLFLAPCRLLANGCLLMMAVDLSYEESEPTWSQKIEGRQVGKYHGHIVAYDYALSLREREEWEKAWGVHSEFYSDEGYDERNQDHHETGE